MVITVSPLCSGLTTWTVRIKSLKRRACGSLLEGYGKARLDTTSASFIQKEMKSNRLAVPVS